MCGLRGTPHGLLAEALEAVKEDIGVDRPVDINERLVV